MPDVNQLNQTPDFLHHYYLDILNCVPDIIYWLDADGMLKGCNHSFAQWLGVQHARDLKGSPYDLMGKMTPWPAKRIEAFKLDDLNVLFSGKGTLQVEESAVYGKNDEVSYFLSTRAPLRNEQQQIIGVVIVLTDITSSKKQALAKAKEAASSTPIVIDPHKKLKVLLVEDNQIAQKVEESLLTSLNCSVEVAHSGDIALSLFKPGKYDIIFMDISLEDTSGYVVTKQFREQEKASQFHVPIIALTSHQAEVIMQSCKDYLMEGVITKPISAEQANQIIQHFVYQQTQIEIKGLK